MTTVTSTFLHWYVQYIFSSDCLHLWIYVKLLTSTFCSKIVNLIIPVTLQLPTGMRGLLFLGGSLLPGSTLIVKVTWNNSKMKDFIFWNFVKCISKSDLPITFRNKQNNSTSSCDIWFNKQEKSKNYDGYIKVFSIDTDIHFSLMMTELSYTGKLE